MSNNLVDFFKSKKLDNIPWLWLSDNSAELKWWNTILSVEYINEELTVIAHRLSFPDQLCVGGVSLLKKQISLYKASRLKRPRKKKVKPCSSEDILKELSEYVDKLSSSNVKYVKDQIMILLNRLASEC